MKKNSNFVIIPNIVARNSDIPPIAKALYMAIKSYNPSFPSYARLCKDTGIKSKTTLSKYLKELVILNLIKINDGGYNQSNHYDIVDNMIFEQPDQKLNSPIPKSEHAHIQNMDANNNNLIISNKSLEGSSAIASEEPQGKPVGQTELSLCMANISKGIY